MATTGTKPVINPRIIVGVVDVAGNAIAGAAVSFAPVLVSFPALPGGITDTSGHYTVGTTGYPMDGAYTVSVAAKGYETGTGTVPIVIGVYEKKIVLYPGALAGYTVGSLPPYIAVGNPGSIIVQAPVSAARSYALATATSPDAPGKVVIEAPMDAAGRATLGLDDVVNVPIGPFLATDPAETDTTMSRRYRIDQSIDDGTITRGNGHQDTVAVLLADVDPMAIVNINHLAEWLTPWPNRRIQFTPGTYADVSVLLTAGSYELRQSQYVGTVATAVAPFFFDADGYNLTRVRLPQPIAGATYTELRIYRQNQAASTLLTVVYRVS